MAEDCALRSLTSSRRLKADGIPTLTSELSCFAGDWLLRFVSVFALTSPPQRIASQKSFFVRCKYLFSSDSVLVFPPRLHLRSSTLEQERNMAYVTEKEEDVS